MPTITFNADYVYILTKQGFVSSEATRYYLNGVYVHPCRNQPGAFLVATDGHRSGCFYDAHAVAPIPAIVRLSADALKMSKPHKTDHRLIRVESPDADADGDPYNQAMVGNVTLVDPSGTVLCGKAGDLIGGTFPDWQRVVPSSRNEDYAVAPSACYNATYLAAFGFCHPDRRGSGPSITIEHTDASGPTRVLNSHYPNFLGVLMPMYGAPDTRNGMLPAWYLDSAKPASVDVAA